MYGHDSAYDHLPAVQSPEKLGDFVFHRYYCVDKSLPRHKRQDEELRTTFQTSAVLDYNYVFVQLVKSFPEEGKMRSWLWKFALWYISPFRQNRLHNLVQCRALYVQYQKELFKLPNVWQEQIAKDLLRTQQDFCFYRTSETVARENITLERQDNLCALYRVLYIYSVLNCGYTQGMNELVSLLFMQFKRDHPDENYQVLEADTLFCFQNLMCCMRCLFNNSADGSQEGLVTLLNHRLSRFMGKLLPVYHGILSRNQITPVFYAVTWITSLFSQVNRGPTEMRLLDSIFAFMMLKDQWVFPYYYSNGYKEQHYRILKDLKAKVRNYNVKYRASKAPSGQRQTPQEVRAFLDMGVTDSLDGLKCSELVAQRDIIERLVVPENRCQPGAENFFLLNTPSCFDYLLCVCMTVIEKVGCAWDANSPATQVLDSLQRPLVFMDANVDEIIQGSVQKYQLLRSMQCRGMF